MSETSQKPLQKKGRGIRRHENALENLDTPHFLPVIRRQYYHHV